MGAQTSPGLSDEKAARILATFREGGTLRPFYLRAGRFDAYCKAHPEYARDALPLLEANRAAARLRKGAHIRGKTHCINGHSFAEYARVAVHKGWTTRQCRACERMRYRRGGLMKAEVLEKVTARIIAGSSLSSFTKAGKGGYLVRYDTLARHRRENPDFDHFVIDATKDNKSKGQQRRWRRIRNDAVRDQNNDYYRIRAMLPASFPDKDDVVSDIFESLLNGSLQREDVSARVKHYVTAHNRMFPTKFAMRSLEARLFDNGMMTSGDTISRGLWD
jgi:hypothetical protein